MEQIFSNTDGMLEIAQKLEGLAEETERTELWIKEAEQELGDIWKGTVSDSFRENLTAVAEHLKEVEEELREERSVIERAAAVYVRTENESGRYVERLAITDIF